jgi:uncharacterized membrane protein
VVRVKHLWHHHPAVRSGADLSRGERAADRMRNGMGSWPFVFFFLAAMGTWASANSLLFPEAGRRPFDPYPYILLNLLLSTLAGLQGAILLIAAKRQDQIASELARHDYETNRESKKLLDEFRDDWSVHREEFAELRTAQAEQTELLRRILDRAPVTELGGSDGLD